jgi:hypothetical protein
MKNINRKWWLALVALLCLVPAASAAEKSKPKKRLPEGGSAAVYLLGAGITCLGAMFVRSRVPKAKQP